MRRRLAPFVTAALVTSVLAGCTVAPPSPPDVPQVEVEGNDPRVHPNDPQDPVPPSDFASSSSGQWTGYWDWTWNGTKWVAKWIWVWQASAPGVNVS